MPISRPKKLLLSARWKWRCGPPAYARRAIEEARAVGREQVLPDQRDVRTRLLRREQLGQDRVDHRQQPVVDPGAVIARVQQPFDAAIGTEVAESGEHAVGDQEALELVANLRGDRLERRRALAATDAAQRGGERAQRLDLERHRPGAAQPLAHGGIRRLERVVPVAVPVGREPRARDHARVDHAERALDVLPDRCVLGARVALRVEERHRRVEDRRIVGREQVLREREHRPEDDVAVRIVRADAPLALEEHEPLRPVAVRVLVAVDAQQQVAHRLAATQREQQLDGPLADVARAPAAARVLFETARREVVDQRVVREPGQDVLEPLDVGSERRSRDRQQAERSAHVAPELPAALQIGGAARFAGVASRPAPTRCPVIRKPTDRDAAVTSTRKG